VNILGASDTITRNMLCHFERLNIRNYILIGPGSDFLFDLARRGHPVIDADQFFNHHRAQKVMGFQHFSAELMKNISIIIEHAYFVAVEWVLTFEFWFGKVGRKQNNIIDCRRFYLFFCSSAFLLISLKSDKVAKFSWLIL